MQNDAETRTSFSEKLGAFAAKLNDDEKSMLKEILARGGMTEAELKRAHPVRVDDMSMTARAPKLDAAFFNRLLDW
jgi:hypothetical protein